MQTTERLTIRPMDENDIDLIFSLYSDETILRYSPFDMMDFPAAKEHLSCILREWSEPAPSNLEYAVVRKQDGISIGRCHIERDMNTDTAMIGCHLLQQFWRQGYAREICRALMDYSFRTLGVHRVNALCNPENIGSRRVLERCGMRLEAHFRKKCLYVKHGIRFWQDELQYAILREEWEAARTIQTLQQSEREEDDRMNTVFSRVSIRKYQDRPVEQEKTTAILRAAMQAPSAANQQPWEFYVVTGKEKLEALSGVSPYAGMTRNAPAAIVSVYRKDCLLPDYAQIDLSIAMENLWLETAAQGLGGVWLGIAPIEERMRAVEEILELPENVRAFAIFPYGYPAEGRRQQDRFDENRIHYLK